jgi:hypothetical protein
MEDRLYLRMNTQDGQEFRFWLTRRFVRLLWPVLTRLIESRAQAQTQHLENLEVKKAMASFRHQEALAQTQANAPYQEGRELPLGEAPVLLSRIAVKPGENQTPMLSLHPEQGPGIDLAMGDTLLNAFSKLLADTLKSTEWDLNFALGFMDGDEARKHVRLN